MAHDERRAWLDGLQVGDRVAVSEYNGAPPTDWVTSTITQIERMDLKYGSVDALHLDDGGVFARSDGRELLIHDNARIYGAMNARIEQLAAVTP